MDTWYEQQRKKVLDDICKWPRLKRVDGNLYHYKSDLLIQYIIRDEKAWKLVVPQYLNERILRENHDKPTSCHFGRDKTLKKAKRYFWPKLNIDVELYIKTCLICLQNKVEQHLPGGLMGRRVANHPSQVIAGDIMGPLPKTKNNFRYILVLEDLFTVGLK